MMSIVLRLLEKRDANQMWSERFFLLYGIYKYYMTVLNHLFFIFKQVCLWHVSEHFRSLPKSENFRLARHLARRVLILHSHIPSHLRVSPWLNAQALSLPGVLSTLSFAYRMKPNLFSLVYILFTPPCPQTLQVTPGPSPQSTELVTLTQGTWSPPHHQAFAWTIPSMPFLLFST